MKKSILFLFLTLGMLSLHAQDYLISFAGSGATTTVGTIKVDNLKSGTTVTLNGGDVLHLIPGVGIISHFTGKDNLQLYPNPMTVQSILTFVAPESGNTVISLDDLAGKNVYQTGSFLSAGKHSFRISGMKAGIYIVKIAGNTYNYTTSVY